MAEKIGVIISNDLNGWARVLTDRSGGCGGCHSGTSGCRSCLAGGGKLESRATNDIGAQSGDIVKLSLPAKTVFKGAALLYLLPIVSLFAGAFIGHWVGNLLAWPNSVGAMAGSLVALVAALWVIIRLGHNKSLIRKMTPMITTVIQRADNNSPPASPHPSACCR